jgi:hypothetical protein
MVAGARGASLAALWRAGDIICAAAESNTHLKIVTDLAEYILAGSRWMKCQA